jgi:hypothetical protein
MRSFGLVDDKLHEADFFLTEIAAAGRNWFRIKPLFSAFVSAARSVTFALQGSLSDAPGFKEWYKAEQARLRSSPLARFFHECRTDSQHLGMNPVVGGFAGRDGFGYRFGQPEPDRYAYIPEEDVLTACRSYMRMICEIIDRAYSDFGTLIDPDQRYTPSGLASVGMTIEDVEEGLGLPRGYTDIPWDRPDKDEQRLRLLRRSIPGSLIKPLLSRHLGRDLTYPCGPIEPDYEE